MAAGDGHKMIDRLAAMESGEGLLLLRVIRLLERQTQIMEWMMQDQHRRNMAEIHLPEQRS